MRPPKRPLSKLETSDLLKPYIKRVPTRLKITPELSQLLASERKLPEGVPRPGHARLRKQMARRKGGLITPILTDATRARLTVMFKKGKTMHRGMAEGASSAGATHGIGPYWAVRRGHAKHFASSSTFRNRGDGTLMTRKIKFKNPLVLSSMESSVLLRYLRRPNQNQWGSYATVAQKAYSDFLLRLGYDGLIVVHSGSQRKFTMGNKRQGMFTGQIEAIDLRPVKRMMKTEQILGKAKVAERLNSAALARGIKLAGRGAIPAILLAGLGLIGAAAPFGGDDSDT